MKKNPQLVSIKNTLCNRFDIFFRGITINNRANKGEEGLSVKKTEKAEESAVSE